MEKMFYFWVMIPYLIYSQSSEYFPAHVGDTFEYESSSSESEQKSYAKTIITNIVPKEDGGIDIYYDNSTYPTYYKSANGNIFYYMGGDPPPIWYDFNTTSFDTFYTHLSNINLYVVPYEGATSIFGLNKNARNFSYYQVGQFSSEATQWLAEDFGIVSSSSSNVNPPSSKKLVGCIIDGKEYGTLVSVNENFVVDEFNLFQNYPNPFNPSTIIKYSIPVVGNEYFRSLQTTLKVYDILGNEVATLVNELRAPGNYEVNFDASNLSSGVYIYQLQSGGFSTAKKMILLK